MHAWLRGRGHGIEVPATPPRKNRKIQCRLTCPCLSGWASWRRGDPAGNPRWTKQGGQLGGAAVGAAVAGRGKHPGYLYAPPFTRLYERLQQRTCPLYLRGVEAATRVSRRLHGGGNGTVWNVSSRFSKSRSCAAAEFVVAPRDRMHLFRVWWRSAMPEHQASCDQQSTPLYVLNWTI
jgi:hypothetical protein